MLSINELAEQIKPSTYYKLVHRESGKIIAAGSAKDMHRMRKAKPAGSHFVGITSKAIGDTWK